MVCTVLMLLYLLFVGAPVTVNIHYFVWKLLSVMYEFSFIHSLTKRHANASLLPVNNFTLQRLSQEV